MLLIRILGSEDSGVEPRLVAAYVLAAVASAGELRPVLAQQGDLLVGIMRAIDDLLKPGVVDIAPIEESEEMMAWASANTARPKFCEYTCVLQLAAELVAAAPSLPAFEAAVAVTGLGYRILEAAVVQIKSIRSPIPADRALASLGTVACVRVLTTLCRPEQPDRVLVAHLVGSGMFELLVSTLIAAAFVGERPYKRAPSGARALAMLAG